MLLVSYIYKTMAGWIKDISYFLVYGVF